MAFTHQQIVNHRIPTQVPVVFLLCFCLHSMAQTIGWLNTATDGQARAISNNTSSVWGNPAAVSQPRRLEGEVGVTGIGEDPLVPFTSWIFPVGEYATVGAGIREPDLGAVDRHHFVVSGATQPFLGSWIGARGVVQKNPEDVQLDIGLGGLHRLNAHWSLAWTADHLTEGLDSSDCKLCHQRQFGAGIARSLDRAQRYHVWFDVHFFEFDFDSIKPSYTGGLKIDVGAVRNLQIVVSSRWFQTDRAMEGSMGFVFQQPFFSTLISARYALSHLGLIKHDQSPLHQLSIGIVLDATRDHAPPQTFVHSQNAKISPEGRYDLPRETYFFCRVKEETGKLSHWSLVVYTARPDLNPGQLVRRFQGSGLPPHAIRWSGDDAMGIPVSAGTYAYRLIAEDQAGNQAWTEWQFLEIQ